MQVRDSNKELVESYEKEKENLKKAVKGLKGLTMAEQQPSA